MARQEKAISLMPYWRGKPKPQSQLYSRTFALGEISKPRGEKIGKRKYGVNGRWSRR